VWYGTGKEADYELKMIEVMGALVAGSMGGCAAICTNCCATCHVDQMNMGNYH